MGKYNYGKALDKLTKWAHKEGYKKVILNYKGISYIDFGKIGLNKPNLIKIEGKYNDEYKVYVMLHELGHHILRRDWEVFRGVLPIAAHAEEKHFFRGNSKYMRRIGYVVSCIEEEYKAWDEGEKLASRFRIRINRKNWYDVRNRSLMSYIRYYSNKKL